MKYGKKVAILLFFILMLVPVGAYAKDYGRINCPKAEMYERADLESRIVGCVIREMKFEIMDTLQNEEDNNWFYIKSDNGIEGYILAEKVEILPATAGKIEQVRSKNNVNMRREGSREADVIGSVPRHVNLKVLEVFTNEEEEIWYLVEHEGVTGYITADAVEIVEPEEAVEEEVEQNDEEPAPQEVAEEQVEETVNEVAAEDVIKEKNQTKQTEKMKTVPETTPEEKVMEKSVPFEVILLVGILAGISLCILLACKIKKLMKQGI